jgi:two-component system, chemotaxis family, CheB/CheR fusion protein
MSNPDNFYVVGIGASAGGYQALAEFLAHLPALPGAAFLVVQHLKPDVESQGQQQLAKLTSLPVLKATDQQVVQVNCLYWLAENQVLRYANHRLVVRKRDLLEVPYRPIDELFHSLGQQLKHRAMGIVLSGMNDDGARGLATISQRGGIAMVQQPSSARFSQMPHSAIQADHPDFILPPAALAQTVVNLIQSNSRGLWA